MTENKYVRVRIVVPEAQPIEKVIERTPEAMAEEMASIGEGFLHGMPGLPIVIELHPANDLDKTAHQLATESGDE